MKLNSILTLDTETTGIPADFDAPFHKENAWPKLVELAFVVTNSKGRVLHQYADIIMPDRWQIPPNMVHGISHETAVKEGVFLYKALLELNKWLSVCDAVVTHNVDFDLGVLQANLLEEKIPHRFYGKTLYCTQKQTARAVGIVRKKDQGGNGIYKWPSLKELGEYCYYRDKGKAHRALADAIKTSKCFHFLLDTQPKIFSESYLYNRLGETESILEHTDETGQPFFII